MKIVTYEPEFFDEVLLGSPDLPRVSTLRHRSFVDYYYGSSEYCRLSLAVDEQNRLLGLHGVEWLPVQDQGTSLRIGCGSGFHSFRPGVGAYLLSHWLRSCDAGLAFAATDAMHEVIKRLGWTFHAGIRTYCLNTVYSESFRHPLRLLAKTAMSCLTTRWSLARLPTRLPGNLADVTVQEETQYPEDLLAFKSAFGFRLAPDLPYLRWRYGLRLPFVRYRLFRIVAGQRSAGYVILQEGPAGIVVAHSDGSDPALLAAATVHGIAALARGSRDRRQVTLVSSHPTMQQVFVSAGFRHLPRRRKAFAVGTLRGTLPITCPVSEWLVNVDWGDRGLRRPFLDECSASTRAGAGNG